MSPPVDVLDQTSVPTPSQIREIGPKDRAITVMVCDRCGARALRLDVVDISDRLARWEAAEQQAIRTGRPADRDSAAKLARSYRKALRRGERHDGCGGAITRETAVIRDDRSAIEIAAHQLRSRWPENPIGGGRHAGR